MKSGFRLTFSMVSGPNRVLTAMKSASNIRISSFVHPSEIFVWGEYNCSGLPPRVFVGECAARYH
jgi:hypothetical protein